MCITFFKKESNIDRCEIRIVDAVCGSFFFFGMVSVTVGLIQTYIRNGSYIDDSFGDDALIWHTAGLASLAISAVVKSFDECVKNTCAPTDEEESLRPV